MVALLVEFHVSNLQGRAGTPWADKPCFVGNEPSWAQMISLTERSSRSEAGSQDGQMVYGLLHKIAMEGAVDLSLGRFVRTPQHQIVCLSALKRVFTPAHCITAIQKM